MSELKVYHCNEWHNEYTEFYLKSEADKVIEDLEESHKKEVEQLLLTILELKEKLAAPQLVMRLNEPESLFADLETMGRLSHEKDVVAREASEQKAKADKLHSCLKCLVMRDLIKDCPEKKSAIEIVKEYK